MTTPEEYQRDRWVIALDILGDILFSWEYRASKLKLVEVDWLETAAVDGIHLFYNLKFTESLSQQELNFIAAHEVAHIVLGHLWRSPPDVGAAVRDKENPFKASYLLHRWNMACDYAIHTLLVPFTEADPTVFAMPKNLLYDKAYDGMSADQVYDLLAKKDDADLSPTLCSDVMIGQGDKPATAKDLGGGLWVAVFDQKGNPLDISKEDSAGNLLLPSGHSWDVEQGMGQSSGEDEAHNTRVVAPSEGKKPWGEVLRQYMLNASVNDYSWASPDRSYLSRGLIVPGMQSEVLDGVIAIDISGSIDLRMLNRFGGEIEKIRQELPEYVLHVIWCDNKVRKTQLIHTGEEVDWKVSSGTSTNFRPVFEKIESENLSPRFLLYFTDTQGVFPEEAPVYPVLWAACGFRPWVPWGDLLMLED